MRNLRKVCKSNFHLIAVVMAIFGATQLFDGPCYAEQLKKSELRQLQLPISDLSKSLSLEMCEEKYQIESSVTLKKAISGLKTFSKRLDQHSEEISAGNNSKIQSRSICMPELLIEVENSLIQKIEQVNQIEVSIGPESVVCSGGQAFLRPDYKNGELFPLSQPLILGVDRQNKIRKIAELKRALKKIRSSKSNYKDESQYEEDINRGLLKIEQQQLLLNNSSELASYYHSICSKQSANTSSVGSLAQQGDNYNAEGNIRFTETRIPGSEGLDELKEIEGSMQIHTPETDLSVKTRGYSPNRMYNVKWVVHHNGKYVKTNFDLNYVDGSYVKFNLINLGFWEKNGFFRGWEGAPCHEGVGNPNSLSCSFYLLKDTVVVTNFDYCDESSPSSVYFNSINSLERKLVEFARNNPDSSLRIKASGEVGAIAALYTDGSLCATFIDGQSLPNSTPSVHFKYARIKQFLDPYYKLGVKNVIKYHTHDFNSESHPNSIIGPVVDKKGKRVVPPGTIPSYADFRNTLIDYSNFAEFNLTNKIVTSAGNAVIYQVPLNTNPDKLKILSDIINSEISVIRDRNIKKKLTKYPYESDVQAMIDHATKQYRKYGIRMDSYRIK